MTSNIVLLIDQIKRLDSNIELETARMVLLLLPFATAKKNIDSISKLTKLDFLLKHPLILAKALQNIGVSPSLVMLQNFEKSSFESTLAGYKFGPWDSYSRKLLNVLCAKGLVDMNARKGSITLTENGIRLAELLASNDTFQDLFDNAQLLFKHFDKSNPWLTDTIYSVIAEPLSIESGGENEY